jgi:HK97 gp10 family phage protein
MAGVAEIKGLKELDVKLQQLGTKVATDLGKDSVRAGAEVSASAMRSATPKHSGLLKRSVLVKVSARKGSIRGKVVFDKRLFPKQLPYGSFVDQGHFVGKRISLKGFKWKDKAAAQEAYAAISNATGRRRIAAHPFIEQALAPARAASAQTMIKTLVDGIDKAMQPDK